MIRYLLDTDVLSEPTRPEPDPRLLAQLEAKEYRCVTSSVVWMELMFGVLRLPAGKRRSRLAAYVQEVGTRFGIVAFDERAAVWLSRARAYQERRGVARPRYDGIIAATAASRGLTLVTRNMSDFADFPGLTAERWHS